jgi:broad specificity phosphatase PhoE
MNPHGRNPIEWQNLCQAGEISVLLIRHGQTEWNKARRFLGRSDIPLDAEGKDQAQRLARALSATPLAAIYSSPLSRAWTTATILAEDRGLRPMALAGVTELDQGELEGQFGADLAQAYPDFYAAWTADPTHVRIPGGETLAECAARSVQAFHQAVAAHTPGQAIAIVAHRVAISCIICDVLGLPVRFNMSVGQRNTAINLIGYRTDKTQLHRLNDADHLDG